MNYNNKKENKTSNFSVVGCLFAIIGIFFNFIATSSLIVSEYSSKISYLSSEFAKKNYVETDVDSIDVGKNGKLVHFSGQIETKDIITDKKFNISVNNSLSLNRKVEMYQWKETKHTHHSGSGKNRRTTYSYTYDKGWYSYIIDSAFFNKSGHENPTLMIYDSTDFIPENLSIGAHKIPPNSARFLGEPVSVSIDSEKVNLPVNSVIEDDKIYFNVAQVLKAKKEANKDNNLRGKKNSLTSNNKISPSSPQIGDVRITYTMHPVCEASVLAKQENDRIVPFKNPYSGKIGKEKAIRVYKVDKDGNKKELATQIEDNAPQGNYNGIFIIKPGILSVDKMLPKESVVNISIWICRIFSFIFMLIGMGMISLQFRTGCIIPIFIPIVIISAIVGITWLPYKHALGLFSLTITFFSIIICFISWLKRSIS